MKLRSQYFKTGLILKADGKPLIVVPDGGHREGLLSRVGVALGRMFFSIIAPLFLRGRSHN
jgi:hypothetical protein